MRVLLVETTEELRATLREALAVEATRCCRREAWPTPALAAHALCQGQGIDLVLLDLGLPDGDGTDFLLELRRKFSTPLIVISARRVEGAKIELLDAGADDYLVKPFGIGELLARMRVAMRHRGRPLEAAITQYQRRASRST